MRKINLIVIHCTASPNGRPMSISQIRKEHMQRGFSDIGYHYVINVDGSIMKGRPEQLVGAHAKDHNANSLGIALVGGLGGPDKLNPGKFTDAQWDSLKTLVVDLSLHFPGMGVTGHRDLSPDLDGDGQIEPSEWIKLCPTFDVGDWLAAGMRPEPAHVLEPPNA